MNQGSRGNFSNFKKSCTPEFLCLRDGSPLKLKLIKIRKTPWGEFLNFVLVFLYRGPEVSKNNEISESRTFFQLPIKKMFRRNFKNPP